MPPPVLVVAGDSTLKLACRQGDFLFWVTPKGAMEALVGGPDAWIPGDFWEFRDGDSVTITNRSLDLPRWFELHPLEVSGQEVSKMRSKLDGGWKPGDVLDGPNIWRVKSGDRLAWVGESRLGWPSSEGTLLILEIQSCVLVIGESNADPPEGRHVPPGLRRDRTIPTELADTWSFGSPSTTRHPPEVIKRGHRAIEFMRSLGPPNVFADEWRFG